MKYKLKKQFESYPAGTIFLYPGSFENQALQNLLDEHREDVEWFEVVR